MYRIMERFEISPHRSDRIATNWIYNIQKKDELWIPDAISDLKIRKLHVMKLHVIRRPDVLSRTKVL